MCHPHKTNVLAHGMAYIQVLLVYTPIMVLVAFCCLKLYGLVKKLMNRPGEVHTRSDHEFLVHLDSVWTDRLRRNKRQTNLRVTTIKETEQCAHKMYNTYQL